MIIIPSPASAGITGFESPAAEYAQQSCNLEELLIERPSSTFIGTACGDSMQGVGIFDGDLLIVDRSLTAKQHDIVVAVLNGEFVCKILDIDNLMLLSANPSMPPIKIHELDSFSVEGVVSRSIRCHRPTHLLSGN